MSKSPLSNVTEQHGGKDKLLDKVVAAILAVGAADEAKDELRKRLRGVSNRQLLRLDAILGEVKEKWGSREKLVDAIVALEGRPKDADYRKSLLGCSPPRLLDRYRTVERRSKRTKAA